jgi:hypothetical protein
MLKSIQRKRKNQIHGYLVRFEIKITEEDLIVDLNI